MWVRRIVKMMANEAFKPLGLHSTLDFFTMSEEQTIKARKTIESERGPVSFLTLQGVKDLNLSSTCKHLPLNRIQFGPMAQLYENSIR